MGFVDKYWFCQDCHILHGSGDATSFDYYYTMQEAAVRIAACQNGWLKFSQYQIFPDDGYDEFSRSACECCDSPLAGERHEWKAYTQGKVDGFIPVYSEDSK